MKNTNKGGNTVADKKKLLVKNTNSGEKDYKLLGSNCAVTVQSALKGAEKKDGSPSRLVRIITYGISPITGTATEKTPNLIYDRIKQQNKGGEIIKL